MSQVYLNSSGSDPGSPVGLSQNLGIDLSSGTFTVLAADGTNLSSANYGQVNTPLAATPGLSEIIRLTENWEFVDDVGTSTIAGMLWGTTTAVNWGEDIPFWIYSVMHDDDDAVAIGISRSPCMKYAPAAANIGINGTTVTTNQNSLFLLDGVTSGTPTVGDYDGNPMVRIGSFRMQKTGGANDDWTVQAFDDRDGIGRWNTETLWSMPTGQNGSSSGTYFQATTGTQPTFSGNSARYSIQPNGMIYFGYDFNTATAGTGAGELQPTLPTTSLSGNDGYNGQYIQAGVNTMNTATINGAQAYISGIYTNGGSSAYINTSLATNSSLAFNGWYKGFWNG